MRPFSLLLAAALAAFSHVSTAHSFTQSGAAARAQDARPTASRGAIATDYVGTFNGKSIRYRAIVSEARVPTEERRPGARIVSTSYVSKDIADPSRRPVVFLFNGGPIAASVYLHMGAFGPKRVAFPDDLSADTTKLPLVDNPHTILDVADLVFFDPAGTGFSRVEPGVDPSRYFSVVGDAQQTSAFVRTWLRENGRTGSPVYLFGESYGTLRAAQAAQQLVTGAQPIPVAGMVLFGQALNIIEFAQRPGNIISYVVSMPTLSAIAWYHRKIDRRGRSLEQFLDESRRFARNEYLRALYDGNRLPSAERARVAARLEALTGLPASYYLANNLRITKEAYRRELFRDEGLILGRNDGRYLAPIPKGAEGFDPSGVVPAAAQRVWLQYMREHLRVPWQDEYVFASAPKGGLEGWRWGATSPFSDWPYMSLVTEVMELVPHFRLLVAVGIYDTSTTVGASEYALAQADWPEDRTAITYYRGGHMAYSDEESFRQLMRDVRAFVRPR